jgi:hypothetical protein
MHTINYVQRLLVAAALLAAMLFSLPLCAQVGLGLAPMRLEVRMAPGNQHSGTVNLTNNSAGKMRIRAELLDFFIDSEATPQFERENKQEAAYSCRQWLSVNPMETELEAPAQLPVRYTIHVPKDVRDGSYQCAAGFTTLPSAEQMTGTGMRMAVRVVAAFYVVVGNPPIEGGLKEFKLESVQDKDNTKVWRAVVVLANSGGMYFRPTGKLDVIDAEGKVVESDDFQSIPVLPNREQRFLFPLKVALEAGQYTLRARVDIGNGEIQEGKAVVTADLPKTDLHKK